MQKIKIITFIIIIFIINFIFPKYTFAQSQSYQISLTATIGEPKLTLFGFTSASTLVQLSGFNVSEETTSDEDGYFIFSRAYLPTPIWRLNMTGQMEMRYPELCVSAVDSENRISFPTCLPPLPVGNFEISVGPVLLPPTFSIDKGAYLPDEQVKAQGKTIPNSQVNILLANSLGGNKNSQVLEIINPPVLAYSLPHYKVQADSKGDFEFNLPVEQSSWLVFATAEYNNSPTPKSNSLEFRVLTLIEVWWLNIKSIIINFISWVISDYWILIIILEIFMIGGLVVMRNRIINKHR